MSAVELVADPSGLLHPVQRHVQQHGADHPALGSSLLGRGEPSLFDHPCLQPLLDLIPGGKGAEMGEQQVVIDSVECRRQIRVEHPPAGGVGTPRHVKDGLNGVVAAPAGTKPIGSRLEPGLPLGFQRADHLRLAHAVDDHGNTERTLFSVRLRDVHALDGLSGDGVSAAHSVGQHGLPGGTYHDLAVNACRLATSVELGHPPHAHERVGAGPKHQLLQIADLLEVPCLRCREDALPQTPYFPLDSGPVDRPPIEIAALRSVHQRGHAVLAPNLSFGSGSLITVVLTGSPDPRQYPFGSGQPPVSGQLCEATGGGPASCLGFLSPFGYRHSLPRSSDPRWETGPSLRSAYRPRHRARISHRGSHVPHVRDATGVGASCISGAAVLIRPTKNPRPAPAASQRPAPVPRLNPSARLTHNETSTEVYAIHPSGLPLARDPWMVQGSFGFPPELRTPPLPATHAEGGPGHRSTCLRLRTRHQPVLQSASPLATCDLVSQLFLAVDADDRLPGRFERGDLLVDVGELDVTVWVIRASFELLAVDVQRIIQLAQQAANRRWAERVASLFQAFDAL